MKYWRSWLWLRHLRGVSGLVGMRFNKEKQELLQGSALVQKAKFMLNEFQMANLQISRATVVEDTRSSLPAPLKCKMNCDGATFAATQLAGVGVVIRDCIGQVSVTLNKRLPYPLGPLEIESMAMEEGVLSLRMLVSVK